MSDLISRADAIEVLMETIAPPSVTLDTLVMRIDALPSAEARPTGEWIFNTSTSNGKSWNVCSECGESMFHPANFCPNCGARMEGGEDE